MTTKITPMGMYTLRLSRKLLARLAKRADREQIRLSAFIRLRLEEDDRRAHNDQKAGA